MDKSAEKKVNDGRTWIIRQNEPLVTIISRTTLHILSENTSHSILLA